MHDALMLWAHRRGDVGLPGGGESTALPAPPLIFSYKYEKSLCGAGLPIVGETYDGSLSLGRHDSVAQPVTPEHVFEALETASDSAVAEGCVGGGTGMITHGFKGGLALPLAASDSL
eukprot:COSAG03_NODE_5902_length_1151_cov_2070.774715_2_plen_117_part_00